jgi:hypothetical protein
VIKATFFTVAVFVVLLIAFHARIIDAIYKNVDDLNDGEMPPTVTSYPSGPEVVSIIGGSGEGLNCSLPPGLDIFFDGSADADGRRHLVRQRFRQACVAHDLCYRHGLATYGYSQNDCDRILQNQAFRLCKYIRNQNKSADSERCQQDSKMILAGVNLGGFDSYRAWDRSTYFEFDSDPTRSSAFSVSRVVDHPFKSIRSSTAMTLGKSSFVPRTRTSISLSTASPARKSAFSNGRKILGMSAPNSDRSIWKSGLRP